MPDSPQYAEVARKAMDYINKGKGPKEAYQSAVRQCLDRESTQNKGCPKNAFLGLCEDGYIKGAPHGGYVIPRNDEKRSKSYAVDAAKILISNPALSRLDNKALWKEVEKVNPWAKDRIYGSQGEMIIVRTLWAAGSITDSPLAQK